MDNISIKLLDALFDLCEGESYTILEADEMTARIPEHSFRPDELTEIMEGFVADGLVDLKYADNKEFCVAMRTKGRSLIKQSRDRLRKLIDEDPDVIAYREEVKAAEEDREEILALQEEKTRILRTQEDKLSEAQRSLEAATTKEERAEKKEELHRVREENKQGQATISDINDRIAVAEVREKSHTTVLPELARGFRAETSPIPPKETKPRARSGRAFLGALIGAALGAAVVNIIFWILFLVKYVK